MRTHCSRRWKFPLYNPYIFPSSPVEHSFYSWGYGVVHLKIMMEVKFIVSVPRTKHIQGEKWHREVLEMDTLVLWWFWFDGCFYLFKLITIWTLEINKQLLPWLMTMLCGTPLTHKYTGKENPK